MGKNETLGDHLRAHRWVAPIYRHAAPPHGQRPTANAHLQPAYAALDGIGKRHRAVPGQLVGIAHILHQLGLDLGECLVVLFQRQYLVVNDGVKGSQLATLTTRSATAASRRCNVASSWPRRPRSSASSRKIHCVLALTRTVVSATPKIVAAGAVAKPRVMPDPAV